MFNKKIYKKIIISSLALSMVIGSVALASEEVYTKKIDAIFGQIKFSHEGREITSEIEEGFTVDSRAYAPLRSIGELLGMDVDYNYMTHTVNIKNAIVDGSEKRLEEKNKEISALKRKINKLKGIEDDFVKIVLKDIEDKLNRKYNKYKQVDFNIVLKEGIEDINIEINTDLTLENTRENWIDMKHGNKKDLIEDAVFQINERLPEYKIKGYIYDKSTEENLYEFGQIEEKLNIFNMDYVDSGFYYDRYFDYTENKDDVKMQVENIFKEKEIEDAELYRLDYTSKTATFIIEFSNKYKDSWEKLEDKEKEVMFEKIIKELENENEHLEQIYGEVYMSAIRVGRYEKEDGKSGEFYQ